MDGEEVGDTGRGNREPRTERRRSARALLGPLNVHGTFAVAQGVGGSPRVIGRAGHNGLVHSLQEIALAWE